MVTNVWSCGGGVQSVAIAALIVNGILPKPDLSVIIDTERERSSTWLYYDSVLKPVLLSVGVDLIRVKKSEFATVDIWGGEDGETFLPGGYYQGRKAPQFCSNEWKARVVHRWMRKQGVQSAKMWMGISIDEMRRVRQSRLGWIENYYPLIYLRMNRSSCVKAVRDIGWPDAPRSACWMCPNAGDREWIEMKNASPNDFEMAVAFERELRLRQPEVTLHPSGKTLDTIDFGERQMTIGDSCDGMCFV